MISTSTTQSIPYRAPWREDDPEAPVFSLRAPSVIERGMMEAELAAPPHRAAQVRSWDLTDAIRKGVQKLFDGDEDQGRILDLLDVEDVADLTEDDTFLLNEVRKVLAEHWPPYMDLLAQAARREAIAPIVALRRFCTGIEGGGVTFSKGRDGQVSEQTLGQLQPMEIVAAGSRAYALAYGVGAGTEKNSEQPPASGEGQKTSGSASKSRAAGKSTGSGGSRIRA